MTCLSVMLSHACCRPSSQDARTHSKHSSFHSSMHGFMPCYLGGIGSSPESYAWPLALWHVWLAGVVV